MIPFFHRLAAALFLTALTGAALIAAAPAEAQDRAGKFDYLTLVLSWSPTYCASAEGRTDPSQCGPGRRYAFVVHGLWPQYERGWPDYCPTPERFVPRSTISAMLDIMPSKRLIIHEWRKHGSCTGLSQRAYFSATRRLFERVKIPARYIAPRAPVVISPGQLAADFAKTNRWLERSMLSIQCGNRRDRASLRDVRICFNRKLEPRPCGDNERRQCGARQLVMPPVR